MDQYVIAKPFTGGLCFLIVAAWVPLSAWVPELELATRFVNLDEAKMIASFFPGAIIEIVTADDSDSEQ